MFQSVDIGAFAEGAETLAEAQPVIGKTAAILTFFHGQAEIELALPGHGNALHILGSAIGEIQIEEGAIGQFHIHQLAQEVRRIGLGDFPRHDAAIGVAEGLAECKGAHALQRAFDGAGNGAGIGHVIGHVGAGIDAGKHEIGLFRQDFANAHDDAIGRRAAQREMLVGNFSQT